MPELCRAACYEDRWRLPDSFRYDSSKQRRVLMAEIVIGIAASHAPNLANPSMLRGMDEEQLGRIKTGFAQARALLEEARPDAIVIFSSDHFDRCFFDN